MTTEQKYDLETTIHLKSGEHHTLVWEKKGVSKQEGEKEKRALIKQWAKFFSSKKRSMAFGNGVVLRDSIEAVNFHLIPSLLEVEDGTKSVKKTWLQRLLGK